MERLTLKPSKYKDAGIAISAALHTTRQSDSCSSTNVATVDLQAEYGQIRIGNYQHSITEEAVEVKTQVPTEVNAEEVEKSRRPIQELQQEIN